MKKKIRKPRPVYLKNGQWHGHDEVLCAVVEENRVIITRYQDMGKKEVLKLIKWLKNANAYLAYKAARKRHLKKIAK